VIVIRRRGEIRCIAPFYLQESRLSLRLSVVQIASLKLRALRLFGDRILRFADDDPFDDVHAIFAELARVRRTFDAIWIFTQRLDDPVWTYVHSRRAAALGFKPAVTSPHPEKLHWLEFEGSFGEYAQRVRERPGYPGKTIRRFWRDNAGRCTVNRVTAPEQVGPFLDDVDRVYNASWQARTYGKQARNTFEHIARMQRLAALGRLRSYVLKDGDTPMAFVVGYQSRGRFSYDETGYDSQFSSASPGSILTYAAIEDLFSHTPPRILDFGFGDGAYKRTFGTASHEICSMYVLPRNRWRLAFAVQRGLNVTYNIVRAALVRVRLDSVVRHLVKRQR
jgi:hypothetical protein